MKNVELAHWSDDELEYLNHCPVCQSDQFKTIHSHLTDNVFFVAGGMWTLNQCSSCKCAFLNPRPKLSSIGKAYGYYYTHASGEPRDELNRLTGYRYLRRLMSNGYSNVTYGTSYSPASRLGVLVARLLPSQREIIDVQFRYLPKPKLGQKLLDVGCGNGAFLSLAKQAGWEVVGIDADHVAVDVCRKSDLNVYHGSVDALTNFSEYFDAITLSHVIEHVHDPVSFLSSIYKLLKPGGYLYIDTPNLSSFGAWRFGRNWRGLEPPRHLVLFNPDNLKELLLTQSFTNILFRKRSSIVWGMYQASARIAGGGAPYDEKVNVKIPLLDRLHMLKAKLTGYYELDFITLTAVKK